MLTYDLLLSHVGHRIVVRSYVNAESGAPSTVSVECDTCEDTLIQLEPGESIEVDN
jgi:hypothetical protein